MGEKNGVYFTEKLKEGKVHIDELTIIRSKRDSGLPLVGYHHPKPQQKGFQFGVCRQV